MRESFEELTIGKLSQRTSVHIETIRYYEKVGLLPAPPRSEGGHRLYGKEHVTRLVFLRRSRELGFSIEEIRALLGLMKGEKYTCGEIKAVTIQHLQTVRQKIKHLRQMEKALASLASQCAGGMTQDCPILETLFTHHA
jgi:MerR family transcriptional regulator, mercuric resistance operon regulatory protein